MTWRIGDMAWLISAALMKDYENSHFSRALEGESLAATYSDGGQSSQLSVMPTPHKFWRNDKTMEFSSLARFGLTCSILTEGRGEDLLTWYREASLARTYRLQEMAPELTVSDPDCGLTWQGSFAKYDQNLHGWRTAQCSLLEDSDEFSETWPRSGTMRNGHAYQRTNVGRLTKEIESGFLLATPTATANQTAPSMMKHRGCREYMVPTQTKHNAKEGAYAAEYTRNTPTLATHAGGKINPEWSEWLMGWPIKWTDLQPLETARFREWTQQHSLSSDPAQAGSNPDKR